MIEGSPATQIPRAREYALRILERVHNDRAYASRILPFEGQELDPSARAFLQHLVKGTLQWQEALDAVVARYLTGSKETVPDEVKLILRLSTYQLLFLDRAPPAIVVNEAVTLTKKRKYFRFSGLVNALLRKVAAQRATLRSELYGEAATPEGLALATSHPEWLVRRWVERWGFEEAKALCVWNNTRWPITVRANALKTDCRSLAELLLSEGVMTEGCKYSSSCLRVLHKNRDLRWEDLHSFQEGLFMIQDESAALVAELMDPKPGETIIDLCSAPGGKTTHLAALMKNEGTIYAVDSHEHRLDLVRENVARLGVTNVECIAGDARTVVLPGPVDRVLVDAPCSGLGVLGRKAEIRWRIVESELNDLVALQGQLMRRAAALVKSGGRVVYSTCTIEPEENEGVIDAFLKECPEFALVPCSALDPALRTERGFYFAIPQRVRMAGAFCAILERKS
ncbi:MAG: 16S rRNA (cytosine(967)-C(5))-methyltransferase RsmB [Bdellovibrionota bacterium]|nr:MAG: 16S rRNA (cytosine(967)-C(5))-methyltransferase RsmB [Bdellovibrionota bacterium]